MAKKLAFDKVLFTTIMLLVGFGLVMVYSASAHQSRQEVLSPLFARQAIAAAIGLAVMASLMHIDYRLLKRRPVIYGLVGLSLLLLIAVLFQPSINNSRRWLILGPLSFQASELAKVVAVAFLAYQIDRRNEDVNRKEFLLPSLMVIGMMAALVMLEPDLGTTAMLVGAASLMVFLAGLSLRFVAVAGGLGVTMLAYLISSAGYRRARLLAFLSPESDPLGSGYQPLQSLIAVGSGGLFGLGQGESMQKLYFLPHPESDFIFSILAEEWGLLGSLALLAGFAVLLWRGIVAGNRAPDRFGRYMAYGFTILLVAQALMNIGVAVAILPTTGIPLPFISYGGSSMLMTLAVCGVLLNISEHG